MTKTKKPAAKKIPSKRTKFKSHYFTVSETGKVVRIGRKF